MNCKVIQDLLPLYVDDCCSQESAELVRKHLNDCPQCKRIKCEMESHAEEERIRFPTERPCRRVQLWKASMLQAIQQFFSFGALIVAVALEAATAAGSRNGFWAVLLLVPITAFLLSQVNWYFVRIYRCRKAFSTGSVLSCFGLGVLGYGWAIYHYGTACLGWNLVAGLVLTAILSAVIYVTSSVYAGFIGKE